ncbi:Uncharacterised protein [Vibrio cholerae]|nr:Uncharacterised protein [Vibrio cholerae]
MGIAICLPFTVTITGVVLTGVFDAACCGKATIESNIACQLASSDKATEEAAC